MFSHIRLANMTADLSCCTHKVHVNVNVNTSWCSNANLKESGHSWTICVPLLLKLEPAGDYLVYSRVLEKSFILFFNKRYRYS